MDSRCKGPEREGRGHIRRPERVLESRKHLILIHKKLAYLIHMCNCFVTFRKLIEISPLLPAFSTFASFFPYHNEEYFLSLKKLLYFIYLFLETGERKEKKRERNVNVWLPLTQLPPTALGDLARKPGLCPNWEPNW